MYPALLDIVKERYNLRAEFSWYHQQMLLNCTVALSAHVYPKSKQLSIFDEKFSGFFDKSLSYPDFSRYFPIYEISIYCAIIFIRSEVVSADIGQIWELWIAASARRGPAVFGEFVIVIRGCGNMLGLSKYIRISCMR